MFLHNKYFILSLCATIIVVLPNLALSRADCTIDSDSLSNAEVASSSKSIFGLRTKARAIAIRCFWPPNLNDIYLNNALIRQIY